MKVAIKRKNILAMYFRRQIDLMWLIRIVKFKLTESQILSLNDFVNIRRRNTAGWHVILAKWSKFFDFQQETPNSESSCFGFPLVLKDSSLFSVAEITQFLNNQHIETRPIICGNIAAQPAMKLFEHRVYGDMRHSNKIMKHGFSFGNHHALDRSALEYVEQKIGEFLQSKDLI
jgi:CDP-6-deoxy-D-xylo-4-hexulose-3-dehydrase